MGPGKGTGLIGTSDGNAVTGSDSAELRADSARLRISLDKGLEIIRSLI